jgi:transposase
MKKKVIRRAIKLKIYPTKCKLNMITSIIQRYRRLVNDFIGVCYLKDDAFLDKKTLELITETYNLSQRYKSNALKQALDILKSKNYKKKPKFNGFPLLDKKFVDISTSDKIFDIWFYLSTLESGKPMYIPSKCHSRLNQWLDKGWQLANSIELRSDYVICYVEIPKGKLQEINSKYKYGVDFGERKLFALSDGEFIGTEFKKYVDKIQRKKNKSKAKSRAIKEKNNYCLLYTSPSPRD